jgi:acetyltransferase-like isoleucine patch superfamily enzyme
VRSSEDRSPFFSRVERLLHEEFDNLHVRQALAELASKALPQLTFSYTRTVALRLLGLSIGERSRVMGALRITGPGSARELFSIGMETLITGPLHVDLGAEVRIGDRVYVGHDVALLTINHEIGPPEQRCGSHVPEPIFIDDGVWIGARATVLPGVTIHRGAVIAAGAVVTRDVAQNSLVGGVPGRVLKDLARTSADSE